MTYLLEHWKTVIGYEGYYEVSNLGSVWSLPRITPDGRQIKGRTLKPRPNGRGYLRVHLSKDGVAEDRYIHLLVLQHFFGQCPLGYEGNHKRGDKSDNRASQLEYMTHAENTKHAGETGLMPRGEDHPNSCLDDGAIIRIRELKGKMMQKEIAALFGIRPGHVRRIQKRKAWAHVV